jgi:hypothetical protein
MKKSFVIVISLVVVGLILGGIAFDRQRAKERQRIAAQKTAAEQAKDKVPPLPQWGALPARGGRSGSHWQRDVRLSLLARGRELVQHGSPDAGRAGDCLCPAERDEERNGEADERLRGRALLQLPLGAP